MIIANRIGMGGSGASGPNGAPSNLAVTVIDENTLQVSFTSGSTNQDGYRAYISTDNITFTEKTTNANTTFNLTGLTEASRYYVYVVSYKGTKESSPSSTVNTYTKPIAPTTLLGTVLNSTQIKLTWLVNSANLDGSRIYISDDNITFTEKGTVAGITATYTASDLANGTLHYFYVVSYKGTTESVSANLVYNTTLPTILDDGHSVARFEPLAVNGAKRASNGVEDIYWDVMIGNDTLGAELNAGSIIKYAVYKITATQADYFYAGCQVGDIFGCLTVKTLGASNKVKRYTGNHLVNGAAGTGPINQIFNGSKYLRTAPFTLAQPTYIYAVIKKVAWTNSSRYWDGNTANTGALCDYSTSPVTRCLVTNYSANNNNWNTGSWAVVRTQFNGAASKLQINATAGTIWDCGAGSMGGFILGGNSAGASGIMQIKEVIIRNIADNGTDEAIIYNYLANKYQADIQGEYFNNGKLVLTFDDGYMNNYTNLLPVLQAKSVPATIFVIGSVVGTGVFMSWTELNAMIAAGCDLEDHTYHHYDLKTLTQSQLNDELNLNDDVFEAAGKTAPTIIGYPYGSDRGSVIPYVIALGTRVAGREAAYANGYIDIYKNFPDWGIPSWPIDNINAAGMTALKALLDTVKANKTAFVTIAHQVESGTQHAYSISDTNISEIIQYAKDIGLDIITLKALHDLFT